MGHAHPGLDLRNPRRQNSLSISCLTEDDRLHGLDKEDETLHRHLGSSPTEWLQKHYTLSSVYGMSAEVLRVTEFIPYTCSIRKKTDESVNMQGWLGGKGSEKRDGERGCEAQHSLATYCVVGDSTSTAPSPASKQRDALPFCMRPLCQGATAISWGDTCSEAFCGRQMGHLHTQSPS